MQDINISVQNPIAVHNYYAVWILPCHIHAKTANKLLCKMVLNLLIVLLHLKQLGLLPLNSYVFLIFIYAVSPYHNIHIILYDTLFDINVWIIFMKKDIWIQIKYVKNIWARQKETEKMKKRLKKNMKKKENERMKLMFDLCKTYVTVNVISMSSLCLTYVKLICHNLCNIIVICHKIA